MLDNPDAAAWADLPAASDVTAIGLYESVGFRVRTRLEFLAVRPPADPHGNTVL